MTQSNVRRVWGIGTSRTLRAHWTLAELELDYETKPIQTRTPAMQDPDFLALSERGKIPILEDAELVIGESAAIALYLADRYRSKACLTPASGSNERAIHDDLCFFIMTEMDALLYVLRRHEGLPNIYGESAVACRAAREYFLRSANEMTRRLEASNAYLLGEEFQVADLILKTCLDWADLCRIPLPDRLKAYSAQVAERPAFGVAMGINET